MRTSFWPLAVPFSFLRNLERTDRHSAGFAPNLSSALFGRSDRPARKGARFARQTTPEARAQSPCKRPQLLAASGRGGRSKPRKTGYRPDSMWRRIFRFSQAGPTPQIKVENWNLAFQLDG